MSISSVAIIGAGPAGLAAAIQLKRYGYDVLLFEAEAIGGLLRNANLVENYPGFPKGIPGVELARLFAEQLQAQGVTVTCARVTGVSGHGGVFQIQAGGQSYQASVLVIAAGSQALTFRDFTIPPEAAGRVIYEIFPVMGLKGKRFTIVGAGDLAFDYALNLGRHNEVRILNRGSETRCLPLLKERAANNPRISYRENTWIEAVSPGPQGGLRLALSGTQGRQTLDCDYLIGAIGRKAQLDFISEDFKAHMADWQQKGRLYLTGDVKNEQYRQASIAIGDGVMAAMQIHQRQKPG